MTAKIVTENPIDDALQAAIGDRLMSMVYAALNSGVAYFDNPKRQMKKWRGWGAYVVAEHLILSASHNWQSHPNTFPVNPWIAEHLRGYEAGDLTYLVEVWLEKMPLPARVAPDPFEEDLKVRRLRKLKAALNP